MKTVDDSLPSQRQAKAKANATPPCPIALPRRRWLALGVAGLAWTAASMQASWALASTAAAAKDPLWDIQLPSLGDSTLRLADHAGQPLIINFWATWCAPCVQELPLLNAFHAKDNGWGTIGIAVDTPANVQRFVQRFQLSFPIGIAGAAGVSLAKELGNTGGLPFTLVVDRKGLIRERKVGQINAADLANWELLA